ncbi:MAG: hypothetical protein RSA00_04050 [Hydrogenoanaerobacterium sp.]
MPFAKIILAFLCYPAAASGEGALTKMPFTKIILISIDKKAANVN